MRTQTKKKNTVLLYTDQQSIKMWEKLNPEQVKELLLGILQYDYDNPENTKFEDPMLDMLWEAKMKEQLDFNEGKYRDNAAKRQAAAKERWNKEKQLQDNNQETDKDMHIADITPNGEFEYTEQGEQFAPKRQTRPVEQASITVQPQQQEMRSVKQPDNSYCDPPHKPGWLPSYEQVARKLNQNRQYSTV